MKVSRRTFVKGSAATAGALVASQYFGGFELLAPQSPKAAAAGVEDWVPSTCWIGKQECGILARRIDGRVVKLEGHPDHPRNLGRLCAKGVAQIMSVYDPNRVKTPLIRTNEKGVSGTWRQASWDEALTLAGEKIKEVRARDPKLLVWQKGRSKAAPFYDNGFGKASGATKLHHGASCSDAGYRAGEYTIGLHGVMHPDFRHAKYVLAWGWNITNAGGNQLCWITWPRQLLDAKERGLKVVAVDPRRRGAGPHADDWLPIKPASDLALALALSHALINQGYVDENYLKKYTNSSFLVQEDGHFLRVDGKEQVWDLASDSIKPFDAPGADPAITGDFWPSGVKVRPAFQRFKDHVLQYTPEWAAEVCDIPAEKIWEVARGLGENAMIGHTRVVDGVEIPYRPVAIMAYHMAQQEMGFQALRAMMIIPMLLGAIGAVGGQRIDVSWKTDGENYKKWDNLTVKDPPYNIYLQDSKFFPINSNNSSVVAKVMLDPAKYGVSSIPEVLILHMSNPLLAFADQPTLIEAYKKFKFVVVIDPWLSETADYFADVVLPAATLEKYEGPMSVSNQYQDATTLRLPLMQPLYQSRGDIDIYLDLCEKAGILYGKGGYLDQLNTELKMGDTYKLDLSTRPVVRDIFDRWAKSQGYEGGITFFETKGVKVKPVSVGKYYPFAMNPPFEGIRHRLYGESLLRLQEEMKNKGADEIYWRDYTPLPTYRKPTMDSSPAEYDLYLISFKKVEFKQSRTATPLLRELAPEQCVEVNPATARGRGIQDGDEVWVESQNAVTGETRKVKAKARYMEGIRPDTVGMSHHYGNWTHPWNKDGGPTPNSLFYTGEGYVANTADQSFHVKVRVYK